MREKPEAGIIAVGTELLRGDLLDTNSWDLARWLYRIGYDVGEARTVPDDEGLLAGALREFMDRFTLVVTTGGLGPTADDVTRAALGRALSRVLEKDEASIRAIRQHFRRRGVPLTENNLRQGWLPRGAQVIANRRGTAPGILVQDRATVLCLPGPRAEWQPMIESVEPEIASLGGGEGSLRASTRILVVGLGESRTEALLEGVSLPPGVTWATYAGRGRMELFVESRAPSKEAAERALAEGVSRLKEILGRHGIGPGTGSIQEHLIHTLRQDSLTLGVAESCTGGLISHLLTSVAGSSEAFLGAVVAYDNSVKRDLLGVDADLIASRGAVSPQVANQMARGARRHLGADLGLGITGIAGPGGGSPEKPVGTCYIALSGPWGEVDQAPRGGDSRRMNKLFFAQAALTQVHFYLLDRET